MRGLPTRLACALTLLGGARAQDVVHGRLIALNDNGAWSWFEDERAVVDSAAGRLYVGSCADSSGIGGAPRSGDIDVAWVDLEAGRFGRFELHDRLQADDHNSPALLVRDDGSVLAMYGTHGGSDRSRWRISAPGDPTSWTPEATYAHGANMSYSNLHHLPDSSGQTAGVTYNFVRAVNLDPNVMRSTDGGVTWTGGGKLLTEGGGSDRPYLKYDHDGARRVHLITTERHPRNWQNSIFHGYVEGVALHDSFGNVVDADITDGAGMPPAALTTVFQNGWAFGGTTMRRAWTIDVVADAGGVVRALFQARANDSANDHRLFFARLEAGAWSVHEVCRMGGYLYSSERDYTGLAALDPDDPSRIFVSTRVDPRSGAGTARYELYEARTPDLGANWTFDAITEQSTVDNLRPIVPAWDAGRTALLWMRGTYSTYTNYDLAVVALVRTPELPFDAADYHDATPANTTRADGSPVFATGPSANLGANDDAWHRRTGFGNGNEVWAASESGSENAPLLRTRLTGLAPGTHDVHVHFWSNPNAAWSLRAGLAPTGLRHLEKQSSQSVGSEHTTGNVVVSGSTVRLYTAWLGRVDVGPSGELDVFVDDQDAGQGGGTRTWYDGLSVARVTCAPSQRFCDALPNSTGAAARIEASGSCSIADNGLTLLASGGPPASFAVFVYGQGRGSSALADGRLCLTSQIGRMAPQQLDVLGFTSRALDLTAPLGSGAAVAVGETWGFQLWFRDATPGGANLSDAVELTFSN